MIRRRPAVEPAFQVYRAEDYIAATGRGDQRSVRRSSDRREPPAPAARTRARTRLAGLRLAGLAAIVGLLGAVASVIAATAFRAQPIDRSSAATTERAAQGPSGSAVTAVRPSRQPASRGSAAIAVPRLARPQGPARRKRLRNDRLVASATGAPAPRSVTGARIAASAASAEDRPAGASLSASTHVAALATRGPGVSAGRGWSAGRTDAAPQLPGEFGFER